MANPHNSPWLRTRTIDPRLQEIVDLTKTQIKTNQQHALLTIKVNDLVVYIARNSAKFRLKSYLDWAHYTPSALAQAIDTRTLLVYYEQQLNSPHSDPNKWKRTSEEQELKSYYAWRAGRASRL